MSNHEGASACSNLRRSSCKVSITIVIIIIIIIIIIMDDCFTGLFFPVVLLNQR